MIPLLEQLDLSDIAFSVMIFAVAITYYVFAKKPTKLDDKSTKYAEILKSIFTAAIEVVPPTAERS